MIYFVYRSLIGFQPKFLALDKSNSSLLCSPKRNFEALPPNFSRSRKKYILFLFA